MEAFEIYLKWPFAFEGGLNLRDIRKANLDFLAKLGWSIITEENSMWVDVIRHKYLKHHDFLSVPHKPTDSYSILKGREVLLQGLGVSISNGKTTIFWTDNWMPDSPLIQHALHPLSNFEASLLVADYCDEYGAWNLTLL